MLEPQLNAAHEERVDRRWWWMSVVAWAGFVAIGSWYPFDFHSATLAGAWSEWWNSGDWGDLSKTDLAVNLLLSIPFGFFGTLAMQPSRPSAEQKPSRFKAAHSGIGRLLSAVVVVVAVAGWGVLVELGQHWLGGRVVSRADSAAQAFGGAIGAAGACWGGAWVSSRVASVAGRQTRRSRFGALLDLYVAGYVVWMWMPFIPAISPSELAARWRSGEFGLTIFSDWQSQPLQVLYSLGVSAATACPLGLWLAARLNGPANRLQRATAAALAALVVVLLEISQFFIETRTTALDDAVGSAVGAAAAAWTSNWLLRGVPIVRAQSFGAAPLLAVGTLLYAMLYVLEAWAPFDFVDSSQALRNRLEELGPHALVGLLDGNNWTHLSSLMRLLFWSAPLGALAVLTAASCRANWFGWGVATVVCSGVCLVAEAGQIMSLTRYPSLPDLVTRLIGCLAGAWLCLRIYRRW